MGKISGPNFFQRANFNFPIKTFILFRFVFSFIQSYCNFQCDGWHSLDLAICTKSGILYTTHNAFLISDFFVKSLYDTLSCVVQDSTYIHTLLQYNLKLKMNCLESNVSTFQSFHFEHWQKAMCWMDVDNGNRNTAKR